MSADRAVLAALAELMAEQAINIRTDLRSGYVIDRDYTLRSLDVLANNAGRLKKMVKEAGRG